MSKDEIVEIVNSDKKGFHIGTRMILPFRCNIIKLIADNHIYTEFVGNNDVKIAQDSRNTSIYFRSAGKLNHFEGSYEAIKLIIASEEDDITEKSTHVKVIAYVLKHHDVSFELPNDDMLFIE